MWKSYFCLTIQRCSTPLTMWSRWKIVIQISIFLLIKVSRSQKSCDWDSKSVENCALKCTKNLTAIMLTLNQMWTERPICLEDGIDLKLENIIYPDRTVAAKFFTADVMVRALTMSLAIQNVDQSWMSEKIETDAFNSNGLKFMKKLVINNVRYTPMEKGTFNGLENLEVLTIYGWQLRAIDHGVLDVLNGTLKEFSLERAELDPILKIPLQALGLYSNKEIWIDDLTGVGAMDQLEIVKFKYNLRTRITRSTFTGLTNVKTLDLSDCEIETIGIGTFDSLQSLEILLLKNNRLTTITDELFKNILITNKTQIYLEGNPFICNCSLMPFKRSLIEHPNFIGRLNCDKPEEYEGHNIIAKNFDDGSCVLPATTTSSPPSSQTSSPTAPTPVPPLTHCLLSDRSSETIFIDPLAHTMQIYQTKDDVVLRVDDLAENSIVIWFSNDDPMPNMTKSVNANCLIGSQPTFHIDNLVTNSVYTLCLMNQMQVTNSPLDCVSFVKRTYPNRVIEPWLYHNAKSTFIGTIFGAYCVSMLLGSVVGGLTYKIWTMKRKEPFVPNHKSLCSSMSCNRASFMTRRTTNTTVQYFINEGFDAAPSLPARPASLFPMDESVYATIPDIRSILAATQASNNFQASNELELKA